MNPKISWNFARMCSWGVLRLTGIKIRLLGEENLIKDGKVVFIANHQSGFDIFSLAPAYIEGTVVIAKKELKWIPLFGLMFVGGGNIFIDRKKHREALAGLKQAAVEMKRRGLSVWMFPEGTRNKTGTGMLPFKKGAFHLAIEAQTGLVPIVSASLEPLVSWKRKQIKAGELFVSVLPLISTAGLEPKDVDRISKEAHALMLKEWERLNALHM